MIRQKFYNKVKTMVSQGSNRFIPFELKRGELEILIRKLIFCQ